MKSSLSTMIGIMGVIVHRKVLRACDTLNLAACLAVALSLGPIRMSWAQSSGQATAVAEVANGFVAAIHVVEGGVGYVEPPSVTVSGGGGSGASASAIVENGSVKRIIVLTAGSGYATPPSVIVSPPDVTTFRLDIVPRITVFGEIGSTNQIQVRDAFQSADVWKVVTNLVIRENPDVYHDAEATTGAHQRYYRVLPLSVNRPAAPSGFVWIPPGSFILGSPDDEPDRFQNEGPQTSVTLTRGFYICDHTVTQDEYYLVTRSRPSTGIPTPDRPVDAVNWRDATNYCSRLTMIEREAGRLPGSWVYRLPTEAEWEYACRAGTRTRFSWGDDFDYVHLPKYAWVNPNAGGTSQRTKQKLPNPWGLFDMHGNMWEWCLDKAWKYPGGELVDPVSDPRSAPPGDARISRGGSYYDTPRLSRSAARNDGLGPDFAAGSIGIRVVLASFYPE